MAKCPHNQQMRLFCLKTTCQHTSVGGCSQCFLTDNSHIKNQDVIELEQLQKLMNKYTFPKNVKPECVNLQDSFFTYFKKIQSEMKQIIVTIDEICKNVVNTIGFPYICFRNHFTVYKRIKNKQYNKISMAEFRKFVTESKEIQLPKLAELEQKLYLKQVNNYHEMIKEIDHMMATFQNVTKYYDQKTKFIHDSAPYLHNKQIVEKIKAQYKSAHTKNQINALTSSTQGQKNKKTIGDLEQQAKMVHSGVHNQQNSELRKTFPSAANQKPQNSQKSSVYQNLLKETSRGTFMADQKKQKQKGRRVSIDNRLVNHRPKLEQKINKLKKTETSNDNQPSNTQSDQISTKQKIKNINLPAADDRNRNQKVGVVSVVPITRRLESKFYEQQQKDQIDSPLLRKKFKSKSKNSRASSQNPKSPIVISSPEQINENKTMKSNEILLKLQKVKQTLPKLTDSQQKSFVLLTASLKLQISQAIPAVQKALQQSKNNLSAAEYLSFLYLESNQFSKCLKICDTYLTMIGESNESNPSRTLLLNNKAAALNSLGRYSQTIKHLSGYQYANQMTIKNLGNAYYGLGFLDQAISLYKKFIEQNFDDEVYYNLGGCLYLIGQLIQAQTAIQLALGAQPENRDYLELQNQITHSSKAILNSTGK